VSKNVEVLIKNYGEKTNSSYKITRLAGSDRYDTAVKVGNEVRKVTKKLDDSVLVDGTNFSDIITISSYASQKRIPILLTEPKKINPTTYEALYRWGINNVTIGGGYNSVSKSIEDKLNISKKERVAGKDRYETAVKISQRRTNSSLIGEK